MEHVVTAERRRRRGRGGGGDRNDGRGRGAAADARSGRRCVATVASTTDAGRGGPRVACEPISPRCSTGTSALVTIIADRRGRSASRRGSPDGAGEHRRPASTTDRSWSTGRSSSPRNAGVARSRSSSSGHRRTGSSAASARWTVVPWWRCRTTTPCSPVRRASWATRRRTACSSWPSVGASPSSSSPKEVEGVRVTPMGSRSRASTALAFHFFARLSGLVPLDRDRVGILLRRERRDPRVLRRRHRRRRHEHRDGRSGDDRRWWPRCVRADRDRPVRDAGRQRCHRHRRRR